MTYTKLTPYRGYTNCACRDCFETAFDGGLCHDCVEAGCERAAGECSRPDAYGVDAAAE